MPSSSSDSKSAALRRRNSLHPAPDKVVDPLFHEGDFFDPRDAVQVKYEMLRRVRQDGWAVSQAASTYGLSRPSYYAALEAFERDGLPGLLPRKRGPRGAHKLDHAVMAWVAEQQRRLPEPSIADLVAGIEQQFGLSVHPRSLERALVRAEKKLQ